MYVILLVPYHDLSVLQFLFFVAAPFVLLIKSTSINVSKHILYNPEVPEEFVWHIFNLSTKCLLEIIR